MRTVVEVKKIYPLDELSEDAQTRAHNDYLSLGFESAWQDENNNTLEAFTKLFNIHIKDYRIDYRYFDWEFTYLTDEIENLSGWRLATYIWNNFKCDIWKGKYYFTPGHYDKDGKYHYKFRKSKILLDVSCPLTGYCFDNDILNPILKFMENPDDNTTYYDLIEQCLHSWIKACQEEYEYQYSFEAFEDTSKTNDWEYLKDGTFYH